MTTLEKEYIENCKAWKDTIPAVIAMNQAMKTKKERKDIDISTWFKFDRTFPAK